MLSLLKIQWHKHNTRIITSSEIIYVHSFNFFLRIRGFFGWPSCTYFMCSYKLLYFISLPQTLHFLSIFSCTDFTWLIIFWLDPNDKSQIGHLCNFSLRWTELTWSLKAFFTITLPHSWHWMDGIKFSWIRLCM